MIQPSYDRLINDLDATKMTFVLDLEIIGLMNLVYVILINE